MMTDDDARGRGVKMEIFGEKRRGAQKRALVSVVCKTLPLPAPYFARTIVTLLKMYLVR